MKADQCHPTSIRLSTEVKRDLRIQAAINDRSLTNEITARLIASLGGERSEASQAT